ncbi:cobalamin biosynthesis protein CbiD, partial [gut metagenome]
MDRKNGLENYYVFRNRKKMRFGYTTGSCAAAAAKGAVQMLLGRKQLSEVTLMTPKGIPLHLLLRDPSLKEGEAS